ncbi:MAG: ribose 5-phosphate isomerase A [Candidatus Bathyarchaeota archaeon]|nr:ribose 5-phosphate isomerase A [Candidatus Bathyarchaeota archaeon]
MQYAAKSTKSWINWGRWKLKANPDSVEIAKKNAALVAVKHVKDGNIVGLGSGTTIAYAIEALGERVKKENLKVLGVPSSYQAFALAVQNKIPVTTLEEHPVIDVNIDGADQIDPKLNLIKGMGAALTREKIVAAASKLNIIIADEKKRVKILGENNHPVPIEVLTFAIAPVTLAIGKLGGKATLRETKGKLGPVISDNGNPIMDVTFGAITDAAKLNQQLKMIPGVIETGLFVNLADMAYLGTTTGTEKLQTARKQTF